MVGKLYFKLYSMKSKLRRENVNNFYILIVTLLNLKEKRLD